jgi:hypothetical protein
MSRKDYVLIAEAIKGIEHPLVRSISANVLAGVLKKDNARFDMVTFFRACDVTPGAVI